MFSKFIKSLPVFVFLFVLSISIFNCSTGVETSPDPGILRVSIQSNPADTFIVVKSDTFTVIGQDSFGVKFFQGKIYNGEKYALLYKNTKSYLTEDLVFNVIKRENNSYKKIIVYESYVPPNNYDRLQIGLNAQEIRVSRIYTRYFYDADGNIIDSKLDTTSITNPVRLPDDASPLMDFEHPFEVKENQITEIVLQINPLSSLQRYKDSYLFSRQVEIIDVKYH